MKIEKQKRGFGAMNPKKQRSIASKGGIKAHAKGVAHEFDHEEAQIAGRKGGLSRSLRKLKAARLNAKKATLAKQT